ncbi:MAG: hypothetical protein WCR72_16985 [Bacteroidota bacterium]
MKTFNENESISNFNAWSGAIDTKQRIIEENKEDEFDSLIEEIYPDGLSEGDLNDLLWFESDWIYESLGISDEEEEETDEEEEE